MSEGIIAWLWVLTAGQFIQAGVLYFTFRTFQGIRLQLRRMDEGERHLDIRVQLADLNMVLAKTHLSYVDDVERRVRKLLDALDADPMAKDRYFTEISALRSTLTKR